MQLQQESGLIPLRANRRAFLGSAAAIAVGSTVGGRLVVQQGTNAQAQSGLDELDAELRKQLKDSVKGMRGTRPGESARKLASTLRITAAQYRSKDLDTDFRRQLRARIRRDGKEAFLSQQIDPQMLAAEMREFGFTTPPIIGPIDYRLRERVLDDLLAHGITPLFMTAATEFERLATVFDAQGPIALVNARQYGCPDLTNQIRIIEIALMVACLWNPVACVVISGMYAGLLISLIVSGC